jgi:extracellular matrix regulatory protein A
MLVNIGYSNMVMSSKADAVPEPRSATMRCLKDDAKERNMLVDATQGSIVMTDSDHVIRSAVQAETLAQRFFGGDTE